MKKYLMITLVLWIATVAFADVTVGTGTATQCPPFGSISSYERSAALYPASEIRATGPITHLKWNVETVGITNIPIKIYITTTAQTSLSATTWSAITTGLTPVYQGTRSFSSTGWTTFDITDYYYTGGNLLVLVETNFGASYSGNSPNIYYSSAPNMHQRWFADGTPPTGNGIVNANRPNITLVGITMTDPPSPTTLVAPENNAQMVNTTTTLIWNSVIGATGYKLYLGTTSSPTLVGDLGNMTSYNVSNLLNDTFYYWKVVPYNSNGNAVGCPLWKFTTVPAGTISIGNGTANSMLPVHPFYNYSYSQSIFLQSEINMPNKRIEKIYFYWNGAGAATHSNEWVVYMGHTDNSTFASTTSWIPLFQLTQVYAGTILLPAWPCWIDINLTNPFYYNNTQNLVIAVDENQPSYDAMDRFFYSTATTGQNRSLRYIEDVTNPDPAAPPTGTQVAAIPNILMRFGNLPVNPVFSYSPASINFGRLLQNTTSAIQNVMVSNNSGGVLNLAASNISLIGPNASAFSFSTANLPAALGPGQSVIIPVSVTANIEGAISATMRMVYNSTNYDVALSATGLPEGSLIIGTGTETSRYPLGSSYSYDRSAALYTAAELGGGNKRIRSLGWYATQASNANVPTKIYLKAFAGNSLNSATWYNHISGATLVFDRNINWINANDWNIFNLTNTFDLRNGQNLLVLVERNYGSSGGGENNLPPAIRATTMSNMHHTVFMDQFEPAGITTAQTTRPNLMLFSTGCAPFPAVVVSPANGATSVLTNAQLNWSSGGGAPAGYKLYFGTSNPPAFIGDLGLVTTYNPGPLAYGTTYYWQVIPYNFDGNASGCPVWSFSVMADPTQNLPWGENFTGVAPGTMPLNWTRTHENWKVQNINYAGGTSPELIFSWNPYATAQFRAITPPLLGNDPAGYKLKFKHYAKHHDGAYTLKVEYSTDLNTWTTLWSITPNGHVGPQTVSLPIPANLIGSPFHLAWTFDGNSFNIDYWYVDDINITIYTVEPPAPPILTYPANATTNLPVTGFNFSWEPDTTQDGTPDYYVLYLSRYLDSVLSDISFETPNTSFNPVTEGGMEFDFGQIWYWTVKAVNADGSGVAMPIPWFAIQESIPDLDTPVITLTQTPMGPLFLNWAAIPRATHYQVYVSSDPYAPDPWTLLDTVSNPGCFYTGSLEKAFFKVVAVYRIRQ